MQNLLLNSGEISNENLFVRFMCDLSMQLFNQLLNLILLLVYH